MNIVHVSDGYLPRARGIEFHVHDLASRQVADGHDVRIITSVAGNPDDEMKAAITTIRPRRLLRVLGQVRRLLPARVAMRAVLIGDGPLRGRLENAVERHGMQDWVTLAGAMSRTSIRAHLTTADIYVAPAVLESFGIAALEARCAGLPVIGRAGSGVEEFVTHDHDGFLATDDEDMARQIVRFATDLSIRRAISGAAGTPPVRFDWSDALPRTYAAYEQVMFQAGSTRTASRGTY